MHEMSEKDYAPREQRHYQHEKRQFDGVVPENARAEKIGNGFVGPHGNGLPGRGDDGPPTPPRTAEGRGSGHHIDVECEDATRAFDTHNVAEPMFETYYQSQLEHAEASLRSAIEIVSGSGVDDESLIRVNSVLHALGNSIVYSRQVLMAIIELRAATTNLIEHTTTRATIAHNAVVDAIDGLAAARTDVSHASQQ